MSKKVYIKTFGCQMNEYDSAKMADVLQAAEGYEPTTDVEEAAVQPWPKTRAEAAAWRFDPVGQVWTRP